jgi:hypothetical protein
MKKTLTAAALTTALLTVAPLVCGQTSAPSTAPKIHSVLLLSIDGMHALDFANCSNGVSGVNSGRPYCPNLAALATTGVNYLQASTTKPSDSFPGTAAQFTGGTPRSTGFYYDVTYNRVLSPPAQTTPYGIAGGPNLCPGTIGTQVGFDEEIDNDLTKLDGGGGINPAYLPRDPKNNCAPVYPHSYLRVNTFFEVVKAAGGYTAWSDKHPSYEFANGPSGQGVDDFFGPEINSTPVNLPNMPALNLACSPLPDQTAVSSSDDYTTSFLNIQCYDALKVQAVINQINGLTHDGSSSAPLPTVFGMNFQAVSVGQKLVEHHATTGGYRDSLGTPSEPLAANIQFVDNSIGLMVAALQKQGQLNTTLIIVSAKHGQSPIDPNRVLRIPADNSSDMPPSAILGSNVAQALEDDVSLIWLKDQTQTVDSVRTLSMSPNAAITGLGEVFSGAAIKLMFADPLVDDRVPDIIVTPNIGVVYTGGTSKIAEHGGFAHDDTHVMLLVSNPNLSSSAVGGWVETRQIAPTILAALGLNPQSLQAVVMENTQKLPGLPF